MVGSLTLFPLADVKGRRFSFISSFVFAFFGLIAIIGGVYMNNWIISSFGQFLCGLFWGTFYSLSYVITSEFCN